MIFIFFKLTFSNTHSCVKVTSDRMSAQTISASVDHSAINERLLNTRAGKQLQRDRVNEEKAAIYNPLNVNHLLPVENTVSALYNRHGAKINERETEGGFPSHIE